jgi:hypothetical protein
MRYLVATVQDAVTGVSFFRRGVKISGMKKKSRLAGLFNIETIMSFLV